MRVVIKTKSYSFQGKFLSKLVSSFLIVMILLSLSSVLFIEFASGSLSDSNEYPKLIISVYPADYVYEGESFQIVVTVDGENEPYVNIEIEYVDTYQVFFSGNTDPSGQITVLVPLVEEDEHCRIIATKDQFEFDMEYCIIYDTPPNGAPEANIAYSPNDPEVGDTITFSGSGSSDPDGDILTYWWDFGDGTTGANKESTHTYQNEGTYDITLTVADSTGQTSTVYTTVEISSTNEQEYTIILNYDTTNGGTVTKYPDKTGYYEDETVIITVNPTTGWKFNNWIIDPVYSLITDLSKNPLTISMPANDITITANFDKPVIIDGSETENNVGNIQGNTQIAIELDNSISHGINRVKFELKESATNVTLNIKKIGSADITSRNIDKPNGAIIRYLDIKLTSDGGYNIAEDEIKSMSFRFRIAKSKLSEENINIYSIIMMRYHDGKWQGLVTKFDGEDESYIYYESNTPGLSTFAVVGKKVINKDNTYSSLDPLIPPAVLYGIIVSGVVILILVLIKYKYVFVDKSSKKERYKR